MNSWSEKQLGKMFRHTTLPLFRLIFLAICENDDDDDYGGGDDDDYDVDYDEHDDYDNDDAHQRRSWLLPSCARLRAILPSKIFDQK